MRCSGSFSTVSFINDILIYTRNLADHRHHVTQVLQCLRHQLYFKMEKCKFNLPSAQFLGYIISQEGIQMDQGKVQAIQKRKEPHTGKELQRFLGFANFYRRFIKNYSSFTTPLTSLLCGKPKSLAWDQPAHEAFENLKTTFSTAPLLHINIPPTSRPPASLHGGGGRLHPRSKGCTALAVR